MKAIVFLLFVICYVQCRKTYPPIDKNANLAFINMEGGAGVRPGQPAAPATPTKAPTSVNKPAVVPTPENKPIVAPTSKPITPVVATIPPTPAKPTPPSVAKPAPTSAQIKPAPVNPSPVANPITTPGPGSVKRLINFYDSQGKASPIRPYSYSQVVKQG